MVEDYRRIERTINTIRVCLIIIWIMFLYISTSISSYAGSYDDEYMESLLESLSPESDTDIRMDLIEQLSENPINLRKADVSDILIIPCFTYSLSLRIIDFVHSHENFDYDMIADSLGIEEEYMYLLETCTYISGPYDYEKKKNFYARIRNEQNINETKGFRDSSFKGSRLGIRQKYTAYYENFRLGTLFSKDPGEKSLFDFYSGYIAGKAGKTRFIAGDYSIMSGMGSLLWNFSGFGSNANVLSNAVAYNSDIIPYTSSMEYNFFRGAALKTEIDAGRHKDISLMLFYSQSSRAASLDDSGDVYTSLYHNNYFRTEDEISKRGKALEKVFGGNLEWKQRNLVGGITAYYIEYDKPVNSESKSALKGRNGMPMAIFGLYSLDDFIITAEAARDASGYSGIKTGIDFRRDKMEISVHFRSFQSGFRSPFGYNFCSSGGPSNETGIYAGIKYDISERITSSFSFDLSRSQTRTYLIPMPERCLSLFSETIYKLSDKLSFSGRMQYSNSTDTYDEGSRKTVYQKSKYRLRVEMRNEISENAAIRLRTEAVYADSGSTGTSEAGAMVFADFSYRVFTSFRIGSRLTYFSSPSFETAIWQYESSVPGSMTIGSLYGYGTRFYINMSYSPFELITFSARYAVTVKNNTDKTGSGLMEMIGNDDKRLLLQLDVEI